MTGGMVCIVVLVENICHKQMLFFPINEIHFEPMDGYSPTVYTYIIVTGLRHVKFLVTLTSFQGHSLVYRISFEQVDRFYKQMLMH